MRRNAVAAVIVVLLAANVVIFVRFLQDGPGSTISAFPNRDAADEWRSQFEAEGGHSFEADDYSDLTTIAPAPTLPAWDAVATDIEASRRALVDLAGCRAPLDPLSLRHTPSAAAADHEVAPVVVVVFSDGPHQGRRTAIRESWRRDGDVDYILVFAVTGDGLEETQRAVDAEARAHGDVLQARRGGAAGYVRRRAVTVEAALGWVSGLAEVQVVIKATDAHHCWVDGVGRAVLAAGGGPTRMYVGSVGHPLVADVALDQGLCAASETETAAAPKAEAEEEEDASPHREFEFVGGAWAMSADVAGAVALCGVGRPGSQVGYEAVRDEAAILLGDHAVDDMLVGEAVVRFGRAVPVVGDRGLFPAFGVSERSVCATVDVGPLDGGSEGAGGLAGGAGQARYGAFPRSGLAGYAREAGRATEGHRGDGRYQHGPVAGTARLAIGILTGPGNVAERRAVRETWMAYYRRRDGGVGREFVGLFLVGNACNGSVNAAVVAEARAHGDMLIMPGLHESYYEVASKVVGFYHVAASHGHLSHALKVDDDAFVRVDAVLAEAGRPENAELLYMGSVAHQQFVQRTGRYGVPVEEFGEEMYPDYVSGAGVLLSRDLLVYMDALTQRVGYKAFRFEDANTGMLLRDAGVEPVHTPLVLGWGHTARWLPRRWMVFHYVGRIGPWSMQTILNWLVADLDYPPQEFEYVRDTDVRRYDLGYTHEGGEPVAEEQCLIDPSCAGFVDLRNVRYLKYKVDPKRRRHARGVSLFVRTAFPDEYGWMAMRDTDLFGHDLFPVAGGTDRGREACLAAVGCKGIVVDANGGVVYLKTTAQRTLTSYAPGLVLYYPTTGSGRNDDQAGTGGGLGWGGGGHRKPPSEREQALARREDLLPNASRRCLAITRASWDDGAPRRSLFAVAAGAVHRRQVDRLITEFGVGSEFDYWILHWDAEADDGGWATPTYPEWWDHPSVRHTWAKGMVKLEWAAEHLTAKATCGYEFVHLWDGDVEVAPPGLAVYDPRRALRIMRENQIDIAQPALVDGSFVSYQFTRHVPGAEWKPNWFVEVGFTIYAAEQWLRYQTLLTKYPFRYWWVDELPGKCLYRAREIGVIHDQAVLHVGGTAGKTLVVTDYINQEKQWRNEINVRYGCCDYLDRIRPTVVDQRDGPIAFTKCRCDLPGDQC